MSRRPNKCAAVVGDKSRHQVEWAQLCQNNAAHIINGVGLCGIHVNALHRGSIEVVKTLEVTG